MAGKGGNVQVAAVGGMADFMPNKFSMIHAVADVVLIVGVTVWLNGKINAQTAEIQALRAENEEMKTRLAQIENVLRQMLSGQAPTVPAPEPPSPKPVKSKKAKKVEAKESPTNSEEESSEVVEQLELE